MFIKAQKEKQIDYKKNCSLLEKDNINILLSKLFNSNATIV